MTFTSIDWRGLSSGVDRIAQNNRNKYTADSSKESSKYTADVNAQTQTSIADKVDIRERDIAAAERTLREKIADKDREGRRDVAKITGMYNLAGQGLRTIPTLLPLVFTGGKGGGNSGNSTNSSSTSKPLNAAEISKQVFKDDLLNQKTRAYGTVPTFRSGFVSTKPDSQVSSSDMSGVNSTSVWNAMKTVGTTLGPTIAAGLATALSIAKFAF